MKINALSIQGLKVLMLLCCFSHARMVKYVTIIIQTFKHFSNNTPISLLFQLHIKSQHGVLIEKVQETIFYLDHDVNSMDNADQRDVCMKLLAENVLGFRIMRSAMIMKIVKTDSFVIQIQMSVKD